MTDNPKRLSFAGIEVPPHITKANFFFLYFNTLIIGILMVIPALLQPAFLKDVIEVSPLFFGSINSFLSIISQVATLFLAGLVGVMSDRFGRRILAFIGFSILSVFFALYFYSNQIAFDLNVPEGFSSYICALISFVPHRAGEFSDFSPGLFAVYVFRLIIGIGFVLAFPQFITMVADYTYEKDRGKGMALNGLMMVAASVIVFSVFAHSIKNYGVETVFYLASGMAFLGALFTSVFLKDHVPEKSRQTISLKEVISIVKESHALKASYLCSLITRADIIVASTFITTWGVMISGDYGLSSESATMKAAVPMIVLSVVSFITFPLIGVLLDKWGRMKTLVLSLLMAGTGMVLLGFCTNPFSGFVFPSVILIALGMPGAVAGANTLASDAAPKELIGTILGGLNTMQPIGVLFFLIISGFLFDKFGASWVFWLKGIATLSLCVWLFFMRKKIV